MNQDSRNLSCDKYAGLPLVIGITGHRDLITEDIPVLKNRVKTVIEKLRDQCPNSSLLLMTALAEGADRPAAEVALENGIGLIVPLPMPQELYEKDFSESSVKEFRKLLELSTITFEIPLEPQNTNDSITFSGTARDRQYHALGRTIIEYCHILIAIWDGVTGGPPGGTSQVVRMQIQGIDDISPVDTKNIFNPLQTGPVFQIVARRKGSDTRPDDAYLDRYRSNRNSLEGVWMLYPHNADDTESREDEMHRTLACIERFNKDSKDIFRLVPDFNSKRDQAAEWVIPNLSDEHRDTFTQKELSPSARQLLIRFAHADVLAQQFQEDSYSNLFLLVCLVPVVVFFFGLYTNVTTAPIAIIGYLVSIGLAYGVYTIMHRHGTHEKFLDYRALAEGMRVAFFWNLAGIRKNPASFYMNKQHSELDWIRYAIKVWGLLACNGKVETVTSSEIMAVRTNWLEDQMRYFGRKTRENRQSANQLGSISTAIYRLGLFIMTPILLVNHGLKLGGERLDAWMLVITPLVLVISGVISYYAERMLFAEHAKQYASMYSVFKKSLHLIDCAESDLHYKQSIILETGKEALAENGDWVLKHRERPIEVPKG